MASCPTAYNANRFVEAINSSAVFVNASSALQRWRAAWPAGASRSAHRNCTRGPMGLEELTTHIGLHQVIGTIRL